MVIERLLKCLVEDGYKYETARSGVEVTRLVG